MSFVVLIVRWNCKLPGFVHFLYIEAIPVRLTKYCHLLESKVEVIVDEEIN